MNKVDITSSRIRLRLIDISDLDAIHTLHTLPVTDKYNTLGIPKNIKETSTIIEPWINDNNKSVIQNYTFAIEEKVNPNFMGLFGLQLGSKKYNRGEVWYKLHTDYWQNGYATESLRAVIQFGFETLGLHRISAGCAVDNIGSIKVLEKAGMIKEGRGRQVLPLKSGWSDNFEYAILETDPRT